MTVESLEMSSITTPGDAESKNQGLISPHRHCATIAEHQLIGENKNLTKIWDGGSISVQFKFYSAFNLKLRRRRTNVR